MGWGLCPTTSVLTRKGEGHAKMEKVVSGMGLQAKECQWPPELKSETWSRFSRRS